MAVSSATSSTGKGIDVATIVSGLMDVERAPVTKLQTQVDQKTLVISTLGVFKSKVSALESAAKAIQTPGVFSLRSTSSSDTAKVSATASNAASTGSYSVKVAQTAQAAVVSVPGFTSATQVLDLAGFSVTHAGATFSPQYAKFAGKTTFAAGDKINFTLSGKSEQTFTVTTQTTVAQVVSAINSAVLSGSLSGVVARANASGELQLSSANAIQGLVADIDLAAGGAALAGAPTQEGLSTTTTISGLTELLNSLDVGIDANLVQTKADSYSLSLASTATGAINSLSVSDLSVLTPAAGPAAHEVQEVSGLSLSTGDVYELTLADNTVLSAAPLGAGSTMTSLVDALKADADYLTSNVEISTDGSKLILTYKSNSNVGDAVLRKTVSETALSSVDGSSGSTEVQTISGFMVDSSKTYSLELADATTLTATNPIDLDDLISQLTTDPAYVSSDVVVTKSGSDLVLTYKTNGNKGDAVLSDGAGSIGSLASVDGSSPAQEVQKTGSLSPMTGDVFELTLADGTVLTTSALTGNSIGNLVAALQADTDYATSNVVISVGAGGDADKLILTYKTNADVGTAALVRTTSVGTLVTTTTGSSGVATYEALSASTLQSARDAFFSVNGLVVQRASNEISDVVNGVTFSLNATTTPAGGAVSLMPDSTAFDALSATTVNVTAGTQDLATSAVTDFVTAYNDLLTFYKEQSASSTDSKKRGVLNTDTSLRTYMERLRSLYGKGVRLADGSTMNFSTMGVEIQRDGSLYLNKGTLNTAVANGLQNKFADGVTLGYESATSSFTSFLTNSLKASSGLLTTHLKDTENQQAEIQKKIDDWEVRLARIQERYYKQYAALDALVFKLQNTSDALASAIESLVNSQKSG